MELKRKISVRKILQVLLTIVVTAGCVVAMVSASKLEGSKTLKGIVVHIRNDKKYHFIEQQQIMDLAINNRHIDAMHTPLARLDVHGMEQVIKQDPWVADAQVYIGIDRVMHMYVTQRVPVARLFQQDGNSFYIDNTLSTMPLSGSYIYYTTVVTNVPQLNNDSIGLGLKKQIVTMVKAIQADTFWNAQISQVMLDSSGMFELLPVLGNQRILFGDTSGMREKFNNLFVFYKDVLNRIGWDKYEMLDLRFKGQVIASPSLPFKGPTDKAIANMNWINSIEMTEAKNDADDSARIAEAKASKALAETDAKAKQPVAAAAITKTTQKGGTAVTHIATSAKPDAKAAQQQKAVAKGAPAKPAAKTVILSKEQKKQAAKAKEAKKAADKRGKVAGKPVGKVVLAKSKAKVTARAVLKKAAKPVKAAAKTKAAKQNNNKNKDTDKKKGAPKYVYPEKKGH